MKKLLSNLASLKLTVVLVLLIGVVLSAGTILESMRGTEAAKAVYEASWLYALLMLFAVNVVCALVDRWPTNRWRIGFAITHLSMLLILAGALVTLVAKTEGQMPIWEGEQSNSILREKAGQQVPPITLPFAIRLDAFELDTYPGTGMPMQYRSRVRIVAGSAQTPGIIEMNKPLSYGGYSFFQSSYRIEEGRRATILSVSRDPGQPIVFVGYYLLVAGMIVVFATRLIQFRMAAATRAPVPLTIGLLAAAFALAAPARALEVPDAATVEKLRVLPVQHDGRTMPFDTQAREAIRKVTGMSSWPGVDHVAMAAGWAFDAQGWQSAPIVKVGGAALAQAAGLPPGTRYASFAQLLASQAFRQASAAAHEAEHEHEGRKPSNLDKDVLKLEGRLETLYGYFQGDAIHPFPSPDAKGAWRSAKGLRSAPELASVPDRVRASGAPSHYPDAKAIAREITYNKVRPGRIAWLLLLPAAIAAGLSVGDRRVRLRPIAAALLVAGFAAMTWGIALRWQIAGRVPASNMYESMLFLGWGVGLFGVVAVLLRQRLLLSNAAGMGALAMLLVDLLPMDPFIHPMMPVLSGTPWLAIHVPIIVVSYSVLAMATGLAHLVVGVEIFAPKRRDLSARWSELLYWYIHVGSILLIAGILTGSIWAASSWGRYWGWDPKEVWSLVAFLAYMAILHARFDEQIREFGVAVCSIAAFWTILMTYLGVNFVLASGLHSYGFGSSSLLQSMALVAAVEIAFLAWGWRARRGQEHGRRPHAPGREDLSIDSHAAR
ncbi:MAG: cytochrome c biogenesis protein ResB [Acidobacteria bacterium]|nr:cytochrome c biogenesis protein ResB [Acidobacteriota bacterium]